MKDLLTIIGDGEKIAVRVTQSEAEVAGLNTEISEMEDALAALRKKGEEAQGRLHQGQEEFEEFLGDLPEDLDAGKAREMIDTRVAQLADMGMLEMVEVKPKRRGGRKKSPKKEGSTPVAKTEPEPEDAKSPEVEEIPAADQPTEEVSTPTEEQATEAATEADETSTKAVTPDEVETPNTTGTTAADEETADETSSSEGPDGEAETDFLEEADADAGDEAEEQQPADDHADLVNELASEVAGENDDGAEQNVDQIAEMAAEDGAEEETAETEAEEEAKDEDDEGSGALDVDFPEFLRESA